MVDYKTDRFLDEERERSYALQMQSYSLALGRLLGQARIEAWLFPASRRPTPPGRSERGSGVPGEPGGAGHGGAGKSVRSACR